MWHARTHYIQIKYRVYALCLGQQRDRAQAFGRTREERTIGEKQLADYQVSLCAYILYYSLFIYTSTAHFNTAWQSGECSSAAGHF